MKRVTALALAIVGLAVVSSRAESPETFDQAKTLSAQHDKPILLEFVRDE